MKPYRTVAERALAQEEVLASNRGTPEQVIDFLVSPEAISHQETVEFLLAWKAGDVSDYPEYTTWLNPPKSWASGIPDPKFVKGDVVFIRKIEKVATVVLAYIHHDAEWAYKLSDGWATQSGWMETELLRVPRTEAEREQKFGDV